MADEKKGAPDQAPTTQPAPTQGEVIQADREAALAIYLLTRSLHPGDCLYNETCESYRSGRLDDWAMIQTFARHRLTFSPSPQDPMLPESEVERVAAALAKAEGLDWSERCAFEADADGGDICESSTCVAAHYEDHDPEIARNNYRRLARAAIAASPPPQDPMIPEGMVPRRPTEAMMDAGLYQSSADAEWADVYSIWTAMFDAALLDGGCSVEAPVYAPHPSPVPTADTALTNPDFYALSNEGVSLPTAPESEVEVTQADREALEQAQDVIYGMPYQWLYAHGLTSEDTHAEGAALWAIAQARLAALHPPAPLREDRDAEEFDRGVLIAVSTLINCWGAGTETEYLLAMIHADVAMVERMGFDDYDRLPLLAALSPKEPTPAPGDSGPLVYNGNFDAFEPVKDTDVFEPVSDQSGETGRHA